MRVGPDLSSYGSELPVLEELLPEEIRYLCDVCRLLAKLGVCGGRRRDDKLDLFDRDELGIDPEEDAEDA